MSLANLAKSLGVKYTGQNEESIFAILCSEAFRSSEEPGTPKSIHERLKFLIDLGSSAVGEMWKLAQGTDWEAKLLEKCFETKLWQYLPIDIIGRELLKLQHEAIEIKVNEWAFHPYPMTQVFLQLPQQVQDNLIASAKSDKHALLIITSYYFYSKKYLELLTLSSISGAAEIVVALVTNTNHHDLPDIPHLTMALDTAVEMIKDQPELAHFLVNYMIDQPYEELEEENERLNEELEEENERLNEELEEENERLNEELEEENERLNEELEEENERLNEELEEEIERLNEELEENERLNEELEEKIERLNEELEEENERLNSENEHLNDFEDENVILLREFAKRVSNGVSRVQQAFRLKTSLQKALDLCVIASNQNYISATETLSSLLIASFINKDAQLSDFYFEQNLAYGKGLQLFRENKTRFIDIFAHKILPHFSNKSPENIARELVAEMQRRENPELTIMALWMDLGEEVSVERINYMFASEILLTPLNRYHDQIEALNLLLHASSQLSELPAAERTVHLEEFVTAYQWAADFSMVVFVHPLVKAYAIYIFKLINNLPDPTTPNDPLNQSIIPPNDRITITLSPLSPQQYQLNKSKNALTYYLDRNDSLPAQIANELLTIEDFEGIDLDIFVLVLEDLIGTQGLMHRLTLTGPEVAIVDGIDAQLDDGNATVGVRANVVQAEIDSIRNKISLEIVDRLQQKLENIQDLILSAKESATEREKTKVAKELAEVNEIPIMRTSSLLSELNHYFAKLPLDKFIKKYGPVLRESVIPACIEVGAQGTAYRLEKLLSANTDDKDNAEPHSANNQYPLISREDSICLRLELFNDTDWENQPALQHIRKLLLRDLFILLNPKEDPDLQNFLVKCFHNSGRTTRFKKHSAEFFREVENFRISTLKDHNTPRPYRPVVRPRAHTI